jgi:hypothetical protein
MSAQEATLERYLSAYEKRYSVRLTKMEVPRERPDYEVCDPESQECFGLEISGVYQDKDEAKIQYWEIENWGKMTGSIDSLVDAINYVLAKKAEKSHSYEYEGPMDLAVWLGSLTYDHALDVDMFRHRIIIPEHSLSRIWLIVREKDDYSPELYRLQ